MQVAIGLGSNLPDRLHWLCKAAENIFRARVFVYRSSSVYESLPWGGIDQPPFLNAVLLGRTDLQPDCLVEELKRLEKNLGRTKTVRFGPREIDIDLLVWGEERWKSPTAQVPHPRLTERDFVLAPLCEVWSAWVHPHLGQPVREIWAEFQRTQPCSATRIGPPLLSKSIP